MSTSSARSLAEPPAQDLGQGWPRGFSRAAELSIGQVVEQIRIEFPALQVSKVRFLEEKGIVSPCRTGTGYRKYSAADVERIRYALALQRDSYLPLSQIAAQLQALDAGLEVHVEPTARVVAADGKLRRVRAGERISLRQLEDYTGASHPQLEAMVKAGLIAADLAGRFAAGAVEVVQHCLALERVGIEPRHLRSMRSAAANATDLVEQAVAPVRGRRGPAEAERANAQALDLGEELAGLATALIRMGIEGLR